MSNAIDIRRAALALFIGALLVAAVVPLCLMIACDGMSGAVDNPMAGLTAMCAAMSGDLLPSGTAAASSLWNMTIQTLAAFSAVGVFAELVGARPALVRVRVPSPPTDPRGARINI